MEERNQIIMIKTLENLRPGGMDPTVNTHQAIRRAANHISFQRRFEAALRSPQVQDIVAKALQPKQVSRPAGENTDGSIWRSDNRKISDLERRLARERAASHR